MFHNAPPHPPPVTFSVYDDDDDDDDDVYECLPAHMYICHMHAWCMWRPEEDIGSPGTAGVTVVSEPNPGLL